MAAIRLGPGERFGHRHQAASTTTLVSGAVRFSCDGTVRLLEAGEVVEVPADAWHESTNVGDGVAVVNCGAHAPEPGHGDPALLVGDHRG